MQTVVERVDRLESLLEIFIDKTTQQFERISKAQAATDRQLSKLEQQITQTDKQIAQMNKQMNEKMAQTDKQIAQMNKQWGNLSNKMGTIVEDLVYPSLDRIIEERFQLKVHTSYLRPRIRRADGSKKEFDAYMLTLEYVFLNSTKSTLKSEYIGEFLDDIKEFRTLCPQYNELPLIGVLSSLNIENDILKYAEKQGFIVLGAGSGVMQIINSEGFEPKKRLH